MKVLVTWASKHGGTEGIARIVAETLEAQGVDVVARPAADVGKLEGFDAVIVGGALYANRWAHSAVRFVERHVAALRKVPVWLLSSGPLDDSADTKEIPPTEQVSVLAERIGAQAHVTFGGRLLPDTQGFPGAAMAKDHAGDWRNPERIAAWAKEVAAALPHATPRPPVDHDARNIPRLLAYGIVGWALCATTMGGLLAATSTSVALVVHAIAAPLFFGLLGWRYFRLHGARTPLQVALVWTALVAILDVIVVALAIQRSFEMFTSIVGTWLPFALIFTATWIAGWIMLVQPWTFAEADADAGSEPQQG